MRRGYWHTYNSGSRLPQEILTRCDCNLDLSRYDIRLERARSSFKRGHKPIPPEAQRSFIIEQEEKTKSRWNWLTLNREYLTKARGNGLPVDMLLDYEEAKLDSDPVFVVRRNKVVHGDIESYKEATGFYKITDFTKPYTLPVAPSEDEACDQIRKSRDFLIQWAWGK